MSSILIKNGFIANMDKNRTVYRQGDLHIEKGRIAALGTEGFMFKGNTVQKLKRLQ